MFYILCSAPDWTAIGAVATGIAAIATVIYVQHTYSILKETAKAATNNAVANELSAYLTLRKDLTTDLFLKVTKHCRLDSIQIDSTGTITNGWKVFNDILTIMEETLVTEVLNNIEDLAIFHHKKVLTIDTIDAAFGYSILHIGNNNAVRTLMNTYRRTGSETYDGFKELYKLIRERLSATEKTSFKEPFS